MSFYSLSMITKWKAIAFNTFKGNAGALSRSKKLDKTS